MGTVALVVCWCWGGHVGLFTITVIYISDTVILWGDYQDIYHNTV